MAITKFIKIRTRLDNCINYAVNPEKTEIENVLEYIGNAEKREHSVYVTTFNCSRENAYKEMSETQKRFDSNRRKDSVLGYHIIMSYKPGEVTPEQAFEYGSEFVKRNLANKYEVVMATHTDREHIHCHIVFNAVSFVDGKKYRCQFKDYYEDIRGLSDDICREHNLSVIENPKEKGKSYAEWDAEKKGKPTIRGRMRTELDDIISHSYTMKEFWRKLNKSGYVVHRKGENIKHTSIIPPFGKRAIRLDSLGDGYIEEAIQQRIMAARHGIRTAPPSQVRKTYKVKGNIKNYPRKKLKGFIALYYHYLYLFGKIRKHKAPQKVSFFLRDELIKMERYQKQFHFLYEYGIETTQQLTEYQSEQENKINDLTEQRKNLYSERRDADEEKKEEISEQISSLNEELKVCRSNVRLCKAIFADSERIQEKYNQVQKLSLQAIEQKEVKKNEHERRSR